MPLLSRWWLLGLDSVMGAGSPVSWFAAVKAQFAGILLCAPCQFEYGYGENGNTGSAPILAIMWELARVAGTSMGAGYPTIGNLTLHHIVDVLKDDLVAVKEYDALHTANAQCAISIRIGILRRASG